MAESNRALAAMSPADRARAWSNTLSVDIPDNKALLSAARELGAEASRQANRVFLETFGVDLKN